MKKYVQVRDELLADIRSGRLKPGERLPTREELLERFGTTRVTLSRAINDLTRLGVIEGRKRGGTIIREFTRRIRTAVICSLEGAPLPWAHTEPDGLAGIFNRIILEGTDLDLQFIDASPILRDPDVLDDMEAALWVQPSDLALAQISQLDRPILVINRYGSDLCYVSTNHREAQRDIASRLLYIAPSDAEVFYLDSVSKNFVFRQRREGFIDACAEHKRFYRIIDMPADFGKAELALMNYRLPEKAVIVSPACQFTGAVLRMLDNCGLKLGESAWYCDFDNSTPRETWGVEIPSVLQDYPAMGEATVEFIRRGMEEPRGVLVPYRITGLGNTDG